MQLFGSYTSPFVRHCRIVLLETGLPCEFVESDASVSATRSPTKKLPFLVDGDLLLTDSSTIIRHLREQAGETFLPKLRDHDHFCLVNTALDAAVNLFLLEKDGVSPESGPYLGRQQQRVQSCLEVLNHLELELKPPYSDFELRLGCFLAWGRFRNRFDASRYPHLIDFTSAMDQYPHFGATAPG